MKSQVHTKVKNVLNRKKQDPNRFIYTGIGEQKSALMQLFKYNSVEINEFKNFGISELPSFDDNESVYWLNVYGIEDVDSVVAICKKYNIHNLAIQDILDVNQRPKFQEYDDFLFLTIKSIVPFSEEILTEQISFVIGANFLISFQEKQSDYFDHLRFRLREKKGIIRERTADYLLYTLLESTLDGYFDKLQTIETETEKFTYLNLKSDPNPSLLELIEKNKRTVNLVKKLILPIKEFTFSIERNDVSLVDKKHRKYFFEINDLCLTLIDNCESANSYLDSATNLFFSLQNHKMNQIIKTLTIVSVIFIPLTFIAGVYGMNFLFMPELELKFGYFAVLLFMLIVALFMLAYFKIKKWF